MKIVNLFSSSSSGRRSLLCLQQGYNVFLKSAQRCCSKSTISAREGPLADLRILDLTRILAGPYCTMLLGDLGAEIIKVEKPGTGDDTRLWGPPYIDGKEENLTSYFVCVNRNKKSIALDLKKGNKLIKDLVRHSDVIVENFVPGTLDKLGLGYKVLQEINPRLIYCSITGFGQDGPYFQRGGYDVIASSLGGLLHITGPEGDGEPCKVGVATTDLATGLYAHGAIMAAVLQRIKTGRGQRIDCNLLSTQIATLVNIGSNYINNGQEAKRWGTAHENIVPYQAFKTKDNRWMTIGAGNNDLFNELCHRINLPQLTTDQKYSSNALRVQHRRELLKIIQDRMMEENCDEWLRKFEGSKLPYSPINDMKHAFEDPQVKHNNMVRQMGPYKFVGPAVNYSFGLNEPRLPPPRLGEHSREILSTVLKLDDGEIDKLFSNNVIA